MCDAPASGARCSERGRRIVRLPEGFGVRAARVGLWVLLWTMVVVWAALLWHPWIDWFGRVRPI
jgi:hypothetical protein